MSLETPQHDEPSQAELAAGARVRRPSLWRHRDFMKLWTAQTVSQLGDEITQLAIAFLTGWLTIWQLFAVAFLVGCLEVFFDVAYQSYLPSVVERDQLVEGNAKLELSASASQIVGPGIAGFLVELVRPALAIFFDVASYLGSVLILLLIRRPETP